MVQVFPLPTASFGLYLHQEHSQTAPITSSRAACVPKTHPQTPQHGAELPRELLGCLWCTMRPTAPSSSVLSLVLSNIGATVIAAKLPLLSPAITLYQSWA